MTVGTASVIDISSAAYGASLSREDNQGPIEAAISSAVDSGRFVYIPPVPFSTPWKIDAAIDITDAQHGVSIIGGSRRYSQIEQQTDNTPIIQASGFIHSLTLEGVQLGYANQQTTSHTDSYGIKLTNPSTDGENKFGWTIRNVTISKAYRGIGIAGSGQIPCWGFTLDQLFIQDIAQDGIWWVSPTAIGMPGNVASQVYIIGRDGDSSGYGWRSAAAEWAIRGLDIEEWTDNVIGITGGNAVSIDGLHLEHIDVTAGSNRMIYVANGHLSLKNAAIEDVDLNATGVCSIIYLDTGGSVSVEEIEFDAAVTSGTLAFLNSANGDSAWVRGYNPHASVSPFTGVTTKVRQFERYGATFQTFTDKDTSPSVLGFHYFKTANTDTTTITTFDDGYPGQEITIVFGDANTTIAETDDVHLTASFSSAAGATMKLVFDGSDWWELSRSATA